MQKTIQKKIRIEKVIKRKMINYMSNDNSFNSWTDKNIFLYKITYFPPYSYNKNKIKVNLDLSNCAAKSDLKMQ